MADGFEITIEKCLTSLGMEKALDGLRSVRGSQCMMADVLTNDKIQMRC